METKPSTSKKSNSNLDDADYEPVYMKRRTIFNPNPAPAVIRSNKPKHLMNMY